jgi:anaerobic selenocysteine-containing dehydrogenase
MVKVESLRGSIRVKARLTEVVHQKIVSVAHGWSNETGANVNCLTDDKAVDPVSGFPEFRGAVAFQVFWRPFRFLYSSLSGISLIS